jgi:hypothetical protein
MKNKENRSNSIDNLYIYEMKEKSRFIHSFSYLTFFVFFFLNIFLPNSLMYLKEETYGYFGKNK